MMYCSHPQLNVALPDLGGTQLMKMMMMMRIMKMGMRKERRMTIMIMMMVMRIMKMVVRKERSVVTRKKRRMTILIVMMIKSSIMTVMIMRNRLRNWFMTREEK